MREEYYKMGFNLFENGTHKLGDVVKDKDGIDRTITEITTFFKTGHDVYFYTEDNELHVLCKKSRRNYNMSIYDKILRDINDCKEKGYEIDYINISYKSYMELFHELNDSYYSIEKPKSIKTIQGLDVKVDLNMQDGYSIVLKELGINLTPIKHITQRLTREEISEFINYILKNYA